MRHADFDPRHDMAVIATSDLLDIVVHFPADHTPVAKHVIPTSPRSHPKNDSRRSRMAVTD